MFDTDAVLEHYGRFDEDARLTSAFGQFEFARTRELIARELTGRLGDILDVGGGTGAYSFWLAELGHRVHLLDVVPRHIEVAVAKQANGHTRLASMAVGDARQLPFPDCSFDALLLAGPLYHLVGREERLRVVQEAFRVLRAGGSLFAIAITRYAGLMYGLQQGLVFDSTYLEMTMRELSVGIRRDPPPSMNTFREAYFHHAADFVEELSTPGFHCGPCLGVIGPGWLLPDLNAAWADPERRDVLMSLSRAVEAESALSPQLFCAARKPSADRLT